jgi:hypothetical protein
MRKTAALMTTLVPLLAGLVAAEEKTAEFLRHIDKRVAAFQPTKADRRFDDIAWTKDIRTALSLAKEHQRPVFLFTHDGHMHVGRC